LTGKVTGKPHAATRVAHAASKPASHLLVLRFILVGFSSTNQGVSANLLGLSPALREIEQFT
jgi:hypothetical protein